MNKTHVLEAVDLCKRYDNGVLALDVLNLQVAAGELYCLLGATNSGKTTIIRLFLGFVRPTSGQALVGGLNVSESAREAKCQLSFLMAGATFYERLSALENLRFFAKIGGRHDVTREELTMALRETGLPEQAFTERVESFTRGMRQKLGLAVAFVKNAPALLLDDPMAGLDPRSTAEFIELLATMRDRGKAILLATESPFQARRLADRLSILREGRQVLSLKREELAYHDLDAFYLDRLPDWLAGPPR